MEQSTLTFISLLFGLYSAAVLIGATLRVPIYERWPGKSPITFTDLLQAIRKEIWSIQFFLQRLTPTGLSKNQNHAERILVKLLSCAAWPAYYLSKSSLVAATLQNELLLGLIDNDDWSEITKKRPATRNL